MIKAIISDFSYVLLMPVDTNYSGSLNARHEKLTTDSNYNLGEHFSFNKDLVSFYKSLKVPVYIFTTRFIQEDAALKDELDNVFKDIFSAARLGIKKDEAGFSAIAEKIGLKPNEIFYIDDIQENVNTAKKVGMDGMVFTSNEEVISKINEIIKLG